MRSVISVSMPQELEKRLDALAKARNKSRSALIRFFIKKGILSEEIGPQPLTKREKFILSHVS